MRRAYSAKKLGNWESFKEECKKEGKLCEWTIERLQEAHDKVSYPVVRLPALRLLPSGRQSTGHGDGSNTKKKHCNWWCAACGGQYEWRGPNRISVVQIGANTDRAKVSKAHAAPLGLCDDLINALQLLANQQKDGDSPIQSIITGLHERIRMGIMDGLRRFIEADNHNAVYVGDLRRGTISVKVRKPQFSETQRRTSERVNVAG